MSDSVPNEPVPASTKPVTVVITPRDRYTGIVECIRDLYDNTPAGSFELVVLDLGYPASIMKELGQEIASRENATLVSYGRIIPMEGMRRYCNKIRTPYTVFLDNDSRVTPGWLEPLLETADKTGAAVINPLTLEKAGVDEGADLRSHLFTNELRVVEAEGKPWLIEHKTFRRALPEEIPNEIRPTQSFELHCVMFRTDALQSVELPLMTIREHLDIGMQLKAMGEKILVDPRSVIHFDNLGTRAALSDLLYFNLRWNGSITEKSSRLFEKRWGYCFYSEKAIYNWAIRRRLFLLLRWFHLPIFVANKIDNVFSGIRRRLFPIWDPLNDPEGSSKPFYDSLENGVPVQLSHDIN